MNSPVEGLNFAPMGVTTFDNAGINVRKTVLPSGLRVITEHMPHVRSVSVGFWVDSGSRHEAETESGITHFIEHMVAFSLPPGRNG